MRTLFPRSVTYIAKTIESTALQTLGSGIMMGRLRKRKALISDEHLLHNSSSAPPKLLEDSAKDIRVLRSRSGKRIPESVLAEALAQSSGLGNRGLKKSPSSRKRNDKTDQSVKGKNCAGKSAARGAAESHRSEELAVLAAGAEPSLIADQIDVPVPQAAPCTPAIFPVWTEAELEKASQHLCEVDPLLAPLVREHGVPNKLLPTATDSAFHGLAHIIIDQQLSIFAAKCIANRVLAACGGGAVLESAAMLKLAPSELRACGLSQAKANYILDLAQRFDSGQLTTEAIVALDDDALYTELSAVKGIGRWSVDMFAMFHAGRPDILPVGDLAVRKGFQALYSLKAIPTDAQMAEIAEKWRPYRSLGSYYMWRVPTTKSSSIKKSKSAPVGVTL